MSFTITVKIADKHATQINGNENANEVYSIDGVTFLEYWNATSNALGYFVEDLEFLIKTHKIKMDVHSEYFEGREGSTEYVRFNDSGEVVSKTVLDSDQSIPVADLLTAQSDGTLDQLIADQAAKIFVEPLV